jgi:histidyl-tRNA synthetase
MFQPPKGTRDILPEEMEKLQFMINIFTSIAEKYGFKPLDTPAFENFEVLAKKGAGEQMKEEIYFFKDKSGRELGLRFDLTLPLARFMANNPNIPKPFKRYQIGKVWRYDNPQALRYREFYQADIDIIGTASMLADAECLKFSIDFLSEIGLSDFSIRLNSRKLLENLLIKLGVKKEKVVEAFRIIDKMDKVGIEEVKRSLLSIKIDPSFLRMLEDKNILKELEYKFQNLEGLDEIKELINYLKIFGIEKFVKLDLSLARGLEYYTGPVFEISLKKEKVSFGGGGRYDKLIKNLGGQDLPATGISFGLDRIISILDYKSNKKRVFVAYTSDKLREKAIEICSTLREDKICDMDLTNRKFSKQLEYANSLKYDFVVIVGEEELESNSVKLKDMKTGNERLVKINELEKFV